MENSIRTKLGMAGAMGMVFLLQGLNITAMGGDVPDNLALHGTTSVSSVHDGAPDKNAAKLNDGLYRGGNSWLGGLSDYKDPVTQKEYPHLDSWWAQIDLGAATQVGAVAFGAESQGRMPKDFTIQVSTDGVDYFDWKKVNGRTEPARVVYDNNPVPARYVKIIITEINSRREGGYSPGIDEIEIYKNVSDAFSFPAPAEVEQPKTVPSLEASQSQGAATFTIAASDSLLRSKANAAYVCDGVDDHIEIQKAIDSLSETKRDTDDPNGGTGGGSIQLLEGTFNIGGTIKFYDKAVNLTGTGKYSTTLKLQRGVNDDMLLVGSGKAHGIPPGRVARMTLSGNSQFQAKGSGIRMLAGDMMVIEDVRIYNFKENGIFLEGPSPEVRPCVGTIQNCRIEYNKKHGIYVGPGLEGWIIQGNRINDNGTIGQPYHGIFIRSIHGKTEGPSGGTGSTIIANNVMWQNKCTQISVDGGGYGGADIIIANNIILSSPYENIKIYDGAHLVTVTGNTLHSASEAGIGASPHITLSKVSYVVVSNNAISSPSSGALSQAVKVAKPGEVEPMASKAILIEENGSDYNKFIGNVIHGEVTKVTLVGAHSYTDSVEEQDKK